MDKVLQIIAGDKFKGVAAVAAAVVMYFCPDEVDKVIEGFLSIFGISCLAINKKV